MYDGGDLVPPPPSLMGSRARVAPIQSRHERCVNDPPGIGIWPASPSIASNRANRASTSPALVHRWRKSRIALASGPWPEGPKPGKRMKDGRSLTRYSVRSSDSALIVCIASTLNIIAGSSGGRPPRPAIRIGQRSLSPASRSSASKITAEPSPIPSNVPRMGMTHSPSKPELFRTGHLACAVIAGRASTHRYRQARRC